VCGPEAYISRPHIGDEVDNIADFSGHIFKGAIEKTTCLINEVQN
jgi:hypothetical protein